MSPIQGFTRNRSHQLGKQSVHGTPVAASKRFHWQGLPDVNPNWTDLDNVDVGSIDTVLSPYRTQTDIQVAYSGPLDFNSIHVLMGAGVRGGVAATGSTAKTWTHQALSLTATTLDELTDEWGDDVTGDGVRLSDGVFEDMEFSFDENLGPWQFTATGRYGAFDARVSQTSGLTVGSNLPLLFGADTQLFVDDSAGGIGGTVLTDTVHKGSIKIGNTIDQKRYANGSNTRFKIGGYGLAAREITGSFVFAKQTTITGSSGEVAKLNAAAAVMRYLKVLVTSTQVIPGTSTPYSWDVRIPCTWRVRAEEDIGGNSVIRLDFKGQLDSTLAYAFYSSVVNDRAALP